MTDTPAPSRTPEQIAAELLLIADNCRVAANGSTTRTASVPQLQKTERICREAAALLRSSPPPSWRELIRAEIEALPRSTVTYYPQGIGKDAIAIESVLLSDVLSRLAAQPAETPKGDQPAFCVTPIYVDEDGEGPVESTDIFLAAAGCSLLVNVPADSRATWVFHAGNKRDRESGTIEVQSASKDDRLAELVRRARMGNMFNYEMRELADLVDAALASPPPTKEHP